MQRESYQEFTVEHFEEPSEPTELLEGTKKARKKRNKKKKEESEDEDAFLDRIVNENKTCPFPGCTKDISRGWCVCRSCNQRFCTLHFMPNSHGCVVRPMTAQPIKQEASQASKIKAKSKLQELQAARQKKMPEKK